MPRKPIRSRNPPRRSLSISGTMGFATFHEVLEVAKTVEDLGFSAFYTSDHLHGVAGAPLEVPLMEPWTLVAGLAAATSRLRLGCMVSGVTYRHPSMLAKVCGTIDVISGGRLEMGIGAAWSRDDHLAYGLPFPGLRERQERLEEAVEILHGLWTQDRYSYEGRYYQVREAPFEPKPVQRPRPPILIAAVSDRALRLAARRAQTWASVSTPAYAAQCIQRLEAFCAEEGRDASEIEYSQYTGLLLTDDPSEVDSVVGARVQAIEAAERRPVNAQVHNAIAGESVEAGVRGSLLAGTPEEVRQQIARYLAVGVTHFIIMTPRPFDRALVERFRKEVVDTFVS